MIRFVACSWILGIACIGQMHPDGLMKLLSTFSIWHWLLGLTGILYLALWRFQHLNQHLLIKWLLILLTSFSSLMMGWQFSERQLSERLALEVRHNETVEGVIYIDQISEGKAESWRQTAQLLIPKQNQTLQILVYPKRLYNASGDPTGFSTDQFKLGHFYQATLNIKPPHGYANQGGFDQEKWLLQENIQGTATVLFAQSISVEQVRALGWHEFVLAQDSILKKWQLKVEKLRLNYRGQLLAKNDDNNGLLLGLLTGDRTGISAETTLLYQQMGISHLLAISGPHVLILAGLMTGLLMTCLHFVMLRGRWERLYLMIPKQRLYLPLFLMFVSFYVAFTGFEIPAVRTWWMVFLISLSLWFRWHISTFTLLLCVASIVLIFDCFAILSAAFWLSFGASAILLLVYQQIQQTQVTGYQSLSQRFFVLLGWLWQSQWRIFIALLPIVLWQFQAVSLISPVINLIAIPFLSVLVVPLDIVAAIIWQLIPSVGNGLWWLNANLLACFNGLLRLLQPIAQILYLPSSLSSILLVSLSIACLIISLPQGLIQRYWGILFLLPCVLPMPPSTLKLDVLDVGQGQAILLRTAKHNILIDTGMAAWQNQGSSMGERVIIPFLRSEGIQHLDELLLTHLDLDHSGGANAILQHLKVNTVRSNIYDDQKIDLAEVPFLACSRGQQWQWDEVNFKILWPLPEDPRRNANESSCVVLIEAPMQGKQFKILLMGDVGWETEYQLLQLEPNLTADLIVLGHHGSKYSSAYDFLKQIQPKLAITSSGVDNRYGHPTVETLARLADLNIRHLDTTQTGQIHVDLAHAQSYWSWRVHRQQRRWLTPTTETTDSRLTQGVH